MRSFTILIYCALFLQIPSRIFNCISIYIWNILPIHYSCIPLLLVISLGDPLPQLCMINKSCIRSISLCYWFSYYDFFRRNSTLNDFIDSSTRESSSWLNKKCILSVILCISLIVKLDIVKINCIANTFMNSYIGSILIKLLLKIRGLRSMSNQMCW